MKNNEIFRGPELFSGLGAYAETEGEADKNDAPVLGKGTAKMQGVVNGLP